MSEYENATVQVNIYTPASRFAQRTLTGTLEDVSQRLAVIANQERIEKTYGRKFMHPTRFESLLSAGRFRAWLRSKGTES